MRTLSGGLPNSHQDTLPSIIFLALFGATSLLCLFRLLRTYRSPTRLLLTFVRMQLFELVRVATFVVRLMGIANYRAVTKGSGTFNETLLIVEQVLLSIGYLMPASTLVKLAGYHSSRREGGDVVGGVKRNITRLMELALMGAIVLGILAGTKVSKAQTDASAAQSVKTERTISAIIVTVVLALLVLFCARVSTARDTPASTSVWLGGTGLVLIVVPIFRLYSTGHPPADSNSTGAKAAFYILQVSVEWLVGASLLAVDAKAWCGIEDAGYVGAYRDEEAHKLAYVSGSY
ncbi:hypothetical protein EWM64_g9388 [Hericium alpestre]|uniref:Uncharacterized protein n=1 Tax=Hericium alpestre TaxID=135208 RepID=A0A4Y9ZL16_9AGAM|nr:hypothetical protein EWM64_g9388 [Hericium alpestre]